MLHHLSIRRCLTALVVLWIVGPAFAQHDNPVYVDDSKRAWEQFRLAAEQREDNLGESVRLYQSLLDDFTFALIPSHTMSQDHFRAVRSRVLDVLRRDDELLARYQEMNGPEAERLLTAGERRAVAVRFALTDAGLDAQLRLAQDLLEQGHFRRAMTWLDEAERHPMLTRADERHVILMSATAARYLGDLATLTRLAARVHQPESPFTDLRATMNTMLDLTVAPAMPSGRRTLDVLETSDLQDLVAQAIWENALSDSLLHRQTSQLSTSGIGSDSQLTDRWLDADLLTSMLTVTDDDVFVNEGHQIHAYNRLTGRWLWTFDDRRRRSSMLTYENEPTLDLNAIAVGEGALVTLTGYAYASKRSGEGGVLCLDPATGAQRWRMVLSDDDLPEVDDGDDLFPHGAPVIHEGSAYILARRVNKQFLTSTYVVALDLQTGEPRWARHICSSAALRRVGRIMSTLTLDAGDVFVATPVGALARLDAGTGELRWLHRFSVPITGTATTRVHRPWEVSAPLVVDGRVIALQPDLSRIVALDRVTGDVIDSHECRSIDLWNSPAYLLSDGFYLYGIGEDIRASRVDMLDSLAWQYPPPQQQMSPTEQPSRTALNLRGRVQLVNEAMIVPTLDAMTILDAETGVELHALDMPGIGNPLAADAQLLLVDGQRLRSYMPFERAEQMLRRRIASNPTDPGPALSLLRLGVRVEDIGIVLESGATVLRIVENHDDFASTRQELFEELLRDDAIELAVAAADGERLFELTEALTDTPEQFVRHALAHSDWLSNINPSRSLAGYHDLLAGTAHAEVPIREGDVRRPTRAIVIDRLFDLRARHGEALFRSIDETAQDRLAAIMPGDESEADLLLELAQRWPTTPAAMRSALRAAPLLLAQRRDNAALHLFRSLDHPERNADDRARLAGAQAFYADEIDWDRTAVGVIGAAKAALGVDRLPTPEGMRQLDAWLATLPRQPLSGRRPTVGPLGDLAGALPGSIVPWHPLSDGAVSGPTDAVLVHRAGGRVQRLASNELTVEWATETDSDRIEILRWTDEDIMLWNGVNALDPFLLRINANTGKPIWLSAPLNELIGDTMTELGRMRPVRRTLPNGLDVDLRETLPVIFESTLVLVRRDGVVIGVDLEDGATVHWRVQRALDEVHDVAVVDGALVLAGLYSGVNVQPTASPALAIMHADAPGTVIHRLAPTGEAPIMWIDGTPLGMVAVGTELGVELIDPHDGTRRWSHLGYMARGSLRGWSTARYLIIEDRTNMLRAFSMETGVETGPFEISSRGTWDPLNLQGVIIDGERLFALHRDRLLAYEPTGRIVGADMVNIDRRYLWSLPANDRIVVISEHAREQVPMPDQRGRQTVRTYHLYDMSPNGKLLGPIIELDPIQDRLRSATLIDGWLLLSTDGNTITLPMPSGSR